MTLPLTGRLRALPAPPLEPWQAPFSVRALLPLADGFLTAHHGSALFRWTLEDPRPVAAYACPPLFHQRLFALDDGGFAVVGHADPGFEGPLQLVRFERDGRASPPRSLPNPGSGFGYRVLGDGRLLRESRDALELVDGARLFNFTHAVSEPGSQRVFAAGPKRLGVIENGQLRNVDAEHLTRALLWHAHELVRVAFRDAVHPGWFLERWDPATLALKGSSETAPVWSIASDGASLTVLGRDASLSLGVPPAGSTEELLNRADLVSLAGPGFAVVARGDRLAVTRARIVPVRCAIPEERGQPAAPVDPRGILEVRSREVQEDYSAYDEFFIRLGDRSSGPTPGAPRVGPWIEGSSSALITAGEGEATFWLRLDAGSMALTELARGPGVTADGHRLLAVRTSHGELAVVRTLDGAQLARAPLEHRVLAGAPHAPWVVAQRRDALLVLDARTLAELGTIAIDAAAIVEVAWRGDALEVQAADGQRHRIAVEAAP